MTEIKRPPRPDGDPAEGFNSNDAIPNITGQAENNKPLTWKDYETLLISRYVNGGMGRETAARFAQGEIKAILAGNHRTRGKPTPPDPQAVIIAYLAEYELSADEKDAYIEAAGKYEHEAHMGKTDAESRAMADILHRRYGAREAVFPLLRLIGFEAVLFMAKLGFRFMPVAERDGKPVPVFKWQGEYRKNFTNDIGQLMKWQAQGFKRFFYLPGLSGFIGFDIDRNHSNGRDGLTGFYEVMRGLAGKTPDRLPCYLRDVPHNLPCFVESPSGGYHLLFRWSGQCKAANLKYGEHNLEIKYLNGGLSLGEKQNGVYILQGNPKDAPELPPFLAELINPQPKPAPQSVTYRGKNKPDLEKILDKVLAASGGHNDAQKKFAWRAAYFGYGLNEVLAFVKSHPDAFGDDADTESVINHAWRSNTLRAAS